jgi:hypothetical protein
VFFGQQMRSAAKGISTLVLITAAMDRDAIPRLVRQAGVHDINY